MKRVLVVTGTPGVGKTIISKALATEISADYVSLTDIVKEDNLILGVDKERDSRIVDIEKLTKRIKDIISSNPKDIVIDGHYAQDVVPSSLVVNVFVLRRNPEDLKAILKERGYPVNKILENVISEILDICLVDAINNFGIKKVSEIDVSYLSVEEVLEEIMQIVNGQKPISVGKVDWLSYLEKGEKLYLLNPISWADH